MARGKARGEEPTAQAGTSKRATALTEVAPITRREKAVSFILVVSGWLEQ